MIGFFIFIFILKFLEMTIYSARIALLTSGQKKSAAFLSIFEITVWAYGTGSVAMKLLDDYYIIIPYLLGSQIGILTGMFIENLISKRDSVIICMTHEEHCKKTQEELSKNNYGVTTLESEDNSSILIITTKKSRINKARKILKKFNKQATIITTAASKSVGGYIY